MNEPVRIHVINLDRDPARYAEVSDQFRRVGLEELLSRVPAVDGQAPDFVAPGYAPHSWRDRWELKISEQAVFESHRSVWERIADSEAPFGVVCEDDILISADFPKVLEALDCMRFGIVKLDGFSADRRYGSRLDMNGWSVRPILEAVPSAACYAVSRTAANRLLADSRTYSATLDDFVFARRDGIEPVQTEPAVSVQQICCTPPEDGGSVRESLDVAAVARGPVVYRLVKELRRSLKRMTARADIRQRPELAADLPPYRR